MECWKQGCLLISSKALEFIVVLQHLLEPNSQNTCSFVHCFFVKAWRTKELIEVEVRYLCKCRCLSMSCDTLWYYGFCNVLQYALASYSSSSHKDSKKINRMPLRPQTWTQFEIESPQQAPLKDSRKVKLKVKRIFFYAVTRKSAWNIVHGDALSTTITFSFTFFRRSRVVLVASKILGWKWGDIALSLR